MDTLFLYNLLVCYYSLLAHFDFQLQCTSKLYLNEPSCRNQFLLNSFFCAFLLCVVQNFQKPSTLLLLIKVSTQNQTSMKFMEMVLCIIPYLDYIFGMTQEKYMSTYITHVELDNLIHINPIPMSRNKMERIILEPSRRLHLSTNS